MKYEQIEHLDTLARTLYGEARGEGVEGMEAVAYVIMNRVKLADDNIVRWWGGNIKDVCLKPWQFSCWNENDPNLEKLKELNDNNRTFLTALYVAADVMVKYKDSEDPTNGATHYHTKSISPAWSQGLIPCAYIGDHVFYNDVP